MHELKLRENCCGNFDQNFRTKIKKFQWINILGLKKQGRPFNIP